MDAAKFVELDKQLRERSFTTISALGLRTDMCRIPSLMHRLVPRNNEYLIYAVCRAGTPSSTLDVFGRTGLHVTAETNSVNSARALIRCGTDIDSLDMF